MTSTVKVRPQERDIDVYGMSHAGRVRRDNQDQYFAATLHRNARIWSASNTDLPFADGPMLALLMVADGVGGGPAGRTASTAALEAVWRNLTDAVDAGWAVGASTDVVVVRRLEQAVEASHRAVRAAAQRDERLAGMATTLTVAAVVWPRLHVVQVGDSRCYRLRGGQLDLLTTDQTMAQALRAQGVPPERLTAPRLHHVLTSAVGSAMTPVTASFDLEWNDVLLLCTDGLTNHLRRDAIRDALATASSARGACRTLVGQAVRQGGSDNVTAVVARLRFPCRG
jgi:protein phosphatase